MGTMVLAPAMFALAFVVAVPEKLEVTLKNQRPSAIASLIKGGNQRPPTIEADDFKSTLVIWGAPEDLERWAKIIPTLDIKPIQFQIRFKVSNDVLKFGYEGTALISNNLAFGISDSDSNAKITYTPRITDKGTVTNIVRVVIEEAEFETVRSSKSAEQFVVKIPEMTAKNQKAMDAVKLKDPRLWPTISLSAALVERKG